MKPASAHASWLVLFMRRLSLVVAALLAAAAAPDFARAQRADSAIASVKLRAPVRIQVRSKASRDSLAVLRADTLPSIEIIEVVPLNPALLYGTRRRCCDVVITTRPRPLPEAALFWLRLDPPHPEPPQN